MNGVPLALLAMLAIGSSSALITSWSRGFDDLADYEVLSSQQAPSKVQCTALASRLAGVQLVTYSPSTAVCAVYKCRLSLSHCRKCRNLNSANQQVWVPSSIAATCWTTVQHRVSASVGFDRTWADYKVGFGEGPGGNFWIGLDSLHSLTSVSGGRKLRFLMKAWSGTDNWAQYSSFSVGPEADKYRLNVSGFSSSHPGLGDSFSGNSGSMFSTMDSDNDLASNSCALLYSGAWWFSACGNMHGNGVFLVPPTAIAAPSGQGIIWANGYGVNYSLKEMEMVVLLY